MSENLRFQSLAGGGCFCAFVMAIACSSVSAQNWRISTNRCKEIEVTDQDGVLSIKTLGKDPQLVGQLIGVKATDTVLEFEHFSPERINRCELFLGPPFSTANRAEIPPIPLSETWQTYAEPIPNELVQKLSKKPTMMRLDLGRKEGIRLQIRSLKLRPYTAQDRQRAAAQDAIRQKKQRDVHQIQKYLKRRFPYEISSINVSSDSILLTGKPLPKSADATQLEIVEHPAWSSIVDTEDHLKINADIVITEQGWTAKLPREIDDRDRLYSGWQLAWKDRLVTPRQFVTQIDPQGKDYPKQRPKPANQKGIGGFLSTGPVDDLVDLGITAVTVNMVLSAFVSENPGPGRKPIPGTRPTAYFNERAFVPHDQSMKWARDNDVIVSAILLIAPRKTPSRYAPLAHPESDEGKFVMPDISTRQGAIIYHYVLNRIARRYRSPSGPVGGITNWIAHNEIDFHYVWTNMGVQPREIVTETYYRSMRMISAATRRYNPHARVFASLTHHWVLPDDGTGKQLSSRDLLIDLQRYCIQEGDFPWGVAYHPYPQSLFSEIAWNDPGITYDETTPYITIQNLEVLVGFMSQPRMRDSSRQVRGILLSEQGFHTDSYDADSQANQAGSLLYAMNKLRGLPSIESFHYHRWIDHPKEGGLKMGLRTLPSEEHPYGTKKRAWHVYQAIGTASESEATAGLPGP